MRIVFMGSPEFAVPGLERLAADGYDIAAVYTQPDRPAGRGRAMTFSPVKKAALTLGLAIFQPEKLTSPEIIADLAEFHPEVIVVAAYGQILPKAVLEMPPYGCINIHPSLLPRHRGASPVAATIMAGDEFTGVTIMKMDEQLDTGPVLSQARIPIAGEDNTGTLTQKLAIIASHLIKDTIIQWVSGEISARPQSETGATYSSQLNKEDGQINWHMPATDIWRRVRAYQPWPGAYTYLAGKRLKIIMGFPLPWSEVVEPGQVVDIRHICARGAFGVGTGDGVLGVSLVQLEGKKITPARDFLSGQRNFIGTKLPY